MIDKRQCLSTRDRSKCPGSLNLWGGYAGPITGAARLFLRFRIFAIGQKYLILYFCDLRSPLRVTYLCNFAICDIFRIIANNADFENSIFPPLFCDAPTKKILNTFFAICDRLQDLLTFAKKYGRLQYHPPNSKPALISAPSESL